MWRAAFANPSLRIAANFLFWLTLASTALVGLGGPSKAEGWLLSIGLAAGFCLAALGVRNRSRVAGLWARSALALGAVGSVWALSLYRTYLSPGGLVAADSLRAIGQTDLREAIEFLVASVSLRGLLVGVLAGCWAWWSVPAEIPGSTGSAAAGAHTSRWRAAMAVACFGALAFGGVSPVWQVVEQARSYRREAAEFARESAADTGAVLAAGATSDFRGSVLLILGESTARAHMGLYGYLRDTTPRLTSRAGDLIVFRDVISRFSSTAPALGSALFSADEDARFEFLPDNSVDLLSLARSAGFKTFWLSNQNEFGVWENPVTALARRADVTRFFSATLGKVYRPTVYDDEMLPAVDEILRSDPSPRKLIVVHLFANHWNYCTNHPLAWRYFKRSLGRSFYGNAEARRELDCYDDGVRYVDGLVDRVIQEAAAQLDPTVVVFLSDHGEAPLFDTKHDSTSHSSYQIEIPLIVWANAAFRESWPDRLRQAALHLDRPYTSARLFHSLADLLSIRQSSVKLARSLFSSLLEDRERKALDGRVTYDRWSRANDYRENARVALRDLGDRRRQVWAHRVDSLGALLEAKVVFSGIEVDAVFEGDPGRFAIRHPPVEATGLTLEQMLEASRDRPDLKIWIDWKNAEAGNLDAALSRLAELDARFGLKGRVILETDSEAIFLEACLAGEAPDCVESLEARVEESAGIVGATAVTYDWRIRSFVEGRLDAWLERRGLDQYAWDTDLLITAGPEAQAAIEERLDRGGLVALLVEFPSAFWI